MSVRLLTVAEAAERLSNHKMTVYRLVWDGVLPYVNLAKTGQRARLRIRESALDDYVNERDSTAAAHMPRRSTRPSVGSSRSVISRP
ncbi:helix-turn-helix domain-containing protein [Plantactinospora soyae]|uniref:helix-turn-helix domain-containing protein n=1 Tax=Plantactinospora soyae TaxID=1544732 RepID=UPI00178B33D1